MCSSAATRHQTLLLHQHLRKKLLLLQLLLLQLLLHLHHLHLLLNPRTATPTAIVASGLATAVRVAASALMHQKPSADVGNRKESALSAQDIGVPANRRPRLLQHQLQHLQLQLLLHLLRNLIIMMPTAIAVTGPTTVVLVMANALMHRKPMVGALNRKIGARSAQDIGAMVAILVASVATFAANNP
jgi:preprotein translocase subunit Sec61beta